MVRHYKRKRPSQWRDKDKRMTLAVQMRAGGLSLRQIAKELGVSSPQTIANDLARWERERGNVVPLAMKPSKTSVQSYPEAGRDWTAEMDSAPTVIQLRRAQGGHA